MATPKTASTWSVGSNGSHDESVVKGKRERERERERERDREREEEARKRRGSSFFIYTNSRSTAHAAAMLPNTQYRIHKIQYTLYNI